jgi:hypothetical protein
MLPREGTPELTIELRAHIIAKKSALDFSLVGFHYV